MPDEQQPQQPQISAEAVNALCSDYGAITLATHELRAQLSRMKQVADEMKRVTDELLAKHRPGMCVPAEDGG